MSPTSSINIALLTLLLNILGYSIALMIEPNHLLTMQIDCTGIDIVTNTLGEWTVNILSKKIRFDGFGQPQMLGKLLICLGKIGKLNRQRYRLDHLFVG
jgi:hypothetical protein